MTALKLSIGSIAVTENMRDFLWTGRMAEVLFETSGEVRVVCRGSGEVVELNAAAKAFLPERPPETRHLEQEFGLASGVWDVAKLNSTPGLAEKQPIHLGFAGKTFQLEAQRLEGDFWLASMIPLAQHPPLDVFSSAQSPEIHSELIIRALEYQQMYLAEERLANTDPLTGIPNRRAFEIALDERLHHFVATEECFSLVILDVDHFKKFNDTHGHQVGDEVLQGLAKVLKGRLRNFDSVFRIGGEEFAVILSASPQENSIEIAERLRYLVSETPVSGLTVTISLGVVTCDKPGWDEVSLVRAADDALYASKQSGRNRVTHHATHGEDQARAVS